LVEDERNDVFFMKRAVTQAGLLDGFQVAEDGQAAIDYLSGVREFADRERFPLPSVVLLDLKLPHVSGLDVLKWMREQPELRTMTVIICTSSQLPHDIEAAYRLGANSYLVKPVHLDELPRIVKLIKEYWLELNQSASG
jgi:CheY-like chemotaxis protein